ncbi:hypothetical protein QCM77_43560 [Bradyrhizobium sp. SSUT18]|uniref:hypothetical protein n=1 Tax=Bradyrhizobium sp. SSUT18 TaxID=3040602 RepID=UPI0024478F6B|nr:hypothetical protein [Bradyrhizobium sp. SSUT18]MDH2406669.1 hypothetical protein [Bradyrhizobium sp. SSUT18]
MEFLSLLPIVKLMMLPVRPTVNGMTMEFFGVQKRKDIARCNEPELTLAAQSGNAPDPHLVEFVRLLARHAARRWYDQANKESRRS